MEAELIAAEFNDIWIPRIGREATAVLNVMDTSRFFLGPLIVILVVVASLVLDTRVHWPKVLVSWQLFQRSSFVGPGSAVD